VQKLTGGMGGVPPCFFLFWVGAEQRRAMRSKRGERQERIIFRPAIARMRGAAISGVRRVFVIRNV
jgi:hypothetical protein